MDHKESFLRYLKVEKHYSPNTICSYRNDLEQFFTFMSDQDSTVGVTDVTMQDVRQWIAGMIDNGISPASVHRKISSLRVFYRYLRKEGITVHDPLEKIILPKRKKRLPVFVDEGAMDKLLDDYDFGSDFSGVRNKTIIEMLYFTGMRRAEMISLKNMDVDLESGNVKVTGKRNKQRIIPLVDSFTGRLRDYLKIRDQQTGQAGGEGWFFVSDRGNKLYDKFVYNIVRRYLTMVTTIEKRSPHILRHTFATHMLNHGADLNSIKELLGHSNLSATQIYTHNTFEKLRSIYKQAHPRA